jgi:signal-transduction protein with cAMP-binding, CBS, and nucleotidyltransferase domain
MILHTNENLQLQVSEIMDKDPAILDLSTSIIEAAKVMRNRGISSVLVSDPQSGLIKGIVTERDILYRVVAEAVGIFKVNIGKIMSSPLIMVGKKTSCLDAILLMRKKGMRRLPVIDDDGKTVGMVTLMSLVGNVPIRSIDLAELEVSTSQSTVIIKCPYCQSEFNDKTDLSSHIDRIHLGSGLLEGDLRNWE